MASRLLLRTLMAGSIAVAPALATALAHADDPGLVLSVPSEVEVWQYPASARPHPTDLPVTYGEATAATLRNHRLTFDAAGLAGTAKLEAGALAGEYRCSTKGTEFTCADLYSWSATPATITTRLKLSALPGTHPGANGSIHVTESADGLPTRTADIQVKITEGSPELDLSPLPGNAVMATAGGDLPESLTVTNVGPLPADKMVVELSLIHGLALPDSFSNCEYARFPKDTPPATEMPDQQRVICTIDQSVQSGESYRLDLGSLGVSQDALNPWMDATIGLAEDTTAQSWRSQSEFRPGSGSALTATKVDHADLNPWEVLYGGHLDVLANMDTTYSLGATWRPADATGLHGILTVDFENPGPGSELGWFWADHVVRPSVHFLLPRGSTVVRAPSDCDVGIHGGELKSPPEDVLCGGINHWLPKGFRETFELEVDLPDGAQGTPLRMTATWVTQSVSLPNGKTTTAKVVLGDSFSSSSPSPSPTDSGPPAIDSPSPAPASTGVSSSAPVATRTSGIRIRTALGLGSAVVLVAYLAVRRRKGGAHR